MKHIEEEEYARRAEMTLDFFHCPLTGVVITTAKTDDKAICFCALAAKTGGTHYRTGLTVASALAYVRAVMAERKRQKQAAQMVKNRKPRTK